jgi:hypothetical protein
MQAPPLAWHQDGQGVLLPFARFADLEPVSIPSGAEAAEIRIRTFSV